MVTNNKVTINRVYNEKTLQEKSKFSVTMARYV